MGLLLFDFALDFDRGGVDLARKNQGIQGLNLPFRIAGKAKSANWCCNPQTAVPVALPRADCIFITLYVSRLDVIKKPTKLLLLEKLIGFPWLEMRWFGCLACCRFR